MRVWLLILLGLVAIAIHLSVVACTRPSRRPGLRVFLGAGFLTAAWLGGVLLHSDDEMRKVSFCAACHEMRPYVESVTGSSVSLAAAHHRSASIDRERACYTCHTRPGLSGFVDAKLTGLDNLKEHYLGNVPEGLSLRREYDTRVCLKCHRSSEGFGAQAAHAPLMDVISTGETSCLECHGPAHDVGD